MKLIKLVGLLAVSALAVAAFAGAGSASADTLCKANENPCSAANSYPIGTVIKGLDPSATLLAGSFEVKCHSEVIGKTTVNHGAGKGILGLIEKVIWSNCSGSCNGATSINTPYLALGSAATQTMTVESDGSGNPGAQLSNCLFNGNSCTYSAASVAMKFVGGNPAKITVTKAPLARTAGLFCPATGEWDATYTLSAPAGLLHLVSSP